MHKKIELEGVSDRVLDEAEAIQKDCHNTIEVLMAKGKNVSYQDATNTYIFIQLAKLSLYKKDREVYYK